MLVLLIGFFPRRKNIMDCYFMVLLFNRFSIENTTLFDHHHRVVQCEKRILYQKNLKKTIFTLNILLFPHFIYAHHKILPRLSWFIRLLIRFINTVIRRYYEIYTDRGYRINKQISSNSGSSNLNLQFFTKKNLQFTYIFNRN